MVKRTIRPRKPFTRRTRKRGMPRLFLKRNGNIALRPHTFIRLGMKSLIYLYNTGTSPTLSSVGSPSTDSGLTLSSYASDSLTGCYQFGFSHFFRLSNVIQSSEFTALFDRYKIVGVRYKIMYMSNMSSVSGGTVLPVIHWTTDTDDADVPASLTTLQAKSSCKYKVFGNQQTIKTYIKPMVAENVYSSSISTGYSVKKAGWVNSVYPDVQHYGIKVWISNAYSPSGSQQAWTIEPEYILTFKDVQ